MPSARRMMRAEHALYLARQLSADFVVSIALDIEVNPLRADPEFYRQAHPFC